MLVTTLVIVALLLLAIIVSFYLVIWFRTCDETFRDAGLMLMFCGIWLLSYYALL